MDVIYTYIKQSSYFISATITHIHICLTNKISSPFKKFLESKVIKVFYPRACSSLQAQEPRRQFCRRQIFHHKLRNRGSVLPEMSRFGSFPLLCAHHSLSPPSLSLSFVYELTLKDLKRPQGPQCGDEESGFG